MQPVKWDDLRMVLALGRAGSFAQAGRDLGVDATTVARRLSTLEGALAARLFERDGRGQCLPTPAGELALRRAEAVEAEVGALAAAVAGSDAQAAGMVRLTAVPIVVNRLLIPALPDFLARHPGLRLELVSEIRDVNLWRRDADIALRLARPEEEAGRAIVARRLGHLDYGAYRAAAGAAPRWLSYEPQKAYLPQARWLARQDPARHPLAALAVNDAEFVLAGALAGLGAALLPRAVGDATPGLERVAVAQDPPRREIWALTHPDLRRLARIRAVLDWLEELFARI